jgi:hypothetical protein
MCPVRSVTYVTGCTVFHHPHHRPTRPDVTGPPERFQIFPYSPNETGSNTSFRRARGVLTDGSLVNNPERDSSAAHQGRSSPLPFDGDWKFQRPSRARASSVTFRHPRPA